MNLRDAFAVLLLAVFPLTRAGADEEDFFSLSIEELQNIRIKTVSKKAEATATSPGIVSVITAEDIRTRGYQSVHEALSAGGGTFTYDNYFTQYNQVSIRGNFSAEHYNSKILFLINGHPIFNTVTGAFEPNAVPIDAVERIEVIRGPVSVVYGTNALSGVINIVTKSRPKSGLGEATYQAGSFETQEGRASFGSTAGDLRYFVSVSKKDQSGYLYQFPATADEAKVGGAHRQFDDTSTAFTTLSYGPFEWDFSYWERRQPSKIGVLPNSRFPIPEWDQDYYYTDLRFKKAIFNGATLNLSARADGHGTKFDIVNVNLLENALYGLKIPEPTATCWQRGKKYGLEAYSNLTFIPRLDAVVGVSYDKYFDIEYFCDYPQRGYSHITPFIGDRDSSDLAAYTNATYKLFENLSIVGGARYTENELTGGHADYRGGIVSSLTDNVTVKALYGTSYRSPSIAELSFSSTPVITGDPNLEFETFQGADLSVNYHTQTFATTATYFWNETDDFITRVARPTNGPIYANTEGTRIQGLELEARFNPFESVQFFAAGTFLTDHEDVRTHQDLLVMDQWLNVGASLGLLDRTLVLSTTAQWNANWGGVGSYALVNFAARYAPQTFERLDLMLTVNNVFDEEYEYAEFVRRNLPAVPATVPTSVLFGARLRF